MDGIQNIITLLNPPPWQQRKWGLEGLKVTPPAEVQPKGQLGLPDAPTPLSLILTHKIPEEMPQVVRSVCQQRGEVI